MLLPLLLLRVEEGGGGSEDQLTALALPCRALPCLVGGGSNPTDLCVSVIELGGDLNESNGNDFVVTFCSGFFLTFLHQRVVIGSQN